MKKFSTLWTHLHYSHRKKIWKRAPNLSFSFSGSWNDAGNIAAITAEILGLTGILDILVQRSITNLYFILLGIGRESWNVMNTNYWSDINVCTLIILIILSTIITKINKSQPFTEFLLYTLPYKNLQWKYFIPVFKG